MANETRPSRSVKDDESNSSKVRQSSGKESTTSAGSAATSGLRRSVRETSSSKRTKVLSPSPPIIRKSERLEEKRTPIQRKSERIEKRETLSSFRKSIKSKKITKSSSSGSKKSGKSSSLSGAKLKKEKKEKSVKELTMETKELGKSVEEDESVAAQPKKKRMDARAYRALFKKQPKRVNAAAHHEEQNRLDKFSQGGSSNCGGGECSRRQEEEPTEESLVGLDSSLHKFAKRKLEVKNGVELSHPGQRHISSAESRRSDDGDGMEVSQSGDSLSFNNAMAKAMSDSPERVQAPELIDSALKGGSLCGDSGKCQEVLPVNNRKRKSVEMGSDTSAIIARKDTCTPMADVISSMPPACERNDLVETCGTCFKRQRVDHDLTKPEFCSCNKKLSQGLCDISINKDRGKPGDSVTVGYSGKRNDYLQQKESSVDLQRESDQNICLSCKLGGKLLCCEGRGCRRSYHLSCLDPPLEDVPLGVWHCPECVRKKIETGVHSVSEGVESIWDEREVEVLGGDGLQKQKQFFVKYKGLAHVHNCWVRESQLILEAPSLVTKFIRKHQVVKWKQVWTLPHRLLQKRLLLSPRECDKYRKGPAGDNLGCHYEWLVKWRSLDYEHATWELENASFLCSPEGLGLIRDYENRRRTARSTSRVDKMAQRERSSSDKLSQMTAGGSPGFDNNYLDYVNKLREFWNKCQNAVVIDDQERIVKVIALMLSLQPDAHQPFLIISTSAALYSWDHEFLRLAPSLYVVVYNGNKDMRKFIRTLEFYEDSGCLLFQVLITSPEVIMTDRDMLECIRWEAIIVDECQRSVISSHFEHIKMLHTDRRLLLVNGQLKDSKDEYLKLLSVLDSPGGLNTDDVSIASSNENVYKLKERLSKYIAYGCMSDSSRFLEYWVPAQLTNVQLELYCATLLSKSMALRSFSKNDSVEALRDILITTRKCSDHPYVADPSLQELLTTGLQPVEYLDVGINASGKLQLLDLMLMEIKKRGLRALILFQAIGGSGRDTIGDILDDFLRQRFGAESYERVEMGVIRSKKEAAMSKFNNKECGRFVFLLEYRACLPSVKLSSVDTVLIFDSDWTPMNNLRALQRITLDSQPEQIKIFRLYSSFTVEENVLILAKQKKIIESLQNITRSTSHMLLMLGVTHLFDNLDKFHCGNTPASSASTMSEQSLMKDIVQEFLSILLQNGEATDTSNLSIILKVQQVGGSYSTSSPLPGELTVPSSDESQPHVFWAKLLEGKNPPWKYRVGSSQRNRKRVQHIDELPRRPEVDSEEVVKKRKKVVNSNVDPPSLKCRPEERTNAGDKEGEHTASQSVRGSTALVNDNLHANHAPTSPWLANSISELPEGNMSESEERRKLHDAQKILHLLLKPQIKQLCQILQLTEDVKDMVEKFLEYVMTNHHVNREPETILQAFQISLCWTAASLLKHKIDHKESLALAKQHLNFDCKKEEVDYVYSLLRCLKKMFLYRTGIFKFSDYPNVCELSSKGVTDDHSHARLSRSMTSSPQKVNGEVEALSLHQEFSDKQVLSQLGSAPEFRLALKDVTKSIKEIQKKCNKQLVKLSQKQEEEKNEIKRTYEEEKSLLEKKHRMESTIFRTCLQSNISLREDKLKILDNEYANKIEVQEQQLEMRLKALEDMHQAVRNKLAEREARWVEDVKSWAQVELMSKTCSNGPECGVKCLETIEQVTVHAGPKNVAPVSGHPSEECIPGKTAPSLPENVPDKAVACSSAVETLAPLHRPDTVNDESNTISSESVSVTGFVNCNGTGASGDVQVKIGSINPCIKECNRDGATSSKPDDEVLEVPVSSSDGTKKVVPSSSEEGRDPLSVPHGEVPMGIRDSSTEFPEKVLSLNLSSTEQIPHEATLSVPGTEVLLKVPETLNSNDGLQNVVSVDGSSLPTEGVPFGVPETVSSNDGLENFLSVTPLSSDEQILDRTSSSMTNGEVQLESAASKVVEFDNTNNHNDGAYAVASDNFIRVDQQDGVDNTINQNSPSQMRSLVNSSSVQPMTTLNQGSPVPFEQALQDECTPISTSAQFPVRDAPANEMQNTSQQVESSVSNRDEAVLSSRLNREAATTEPLTQIQPLSPADSHTGNYVDLPSTGGIEPQLSSGGHTSNQLAQTPTQAVENPVELSNQAVSQPSTSYASHLPIDAPMVGLGTHLSDTRMMPTTEISNPPIPNAAPVASSMSLLLYPDPLQYEFERIRKETDQAENSHKDAKLQLKSDCEKEIEELAAQIRRKYDMKIQEMESEFLLKKKELDANRNKVLMNKILAEAFRSKCMDLRVPGPSGMPRDVNLSFMQQLFQLSMQQNAQRPVTACPSSASPSGASLQNTSLPAASLPTITPAAGPHITNPTVQTFNHSSSVFPSIPTRPPNISPISPPTGNLQVGSEIRAPAPHLQPFRPTSVSPISLSSLPRGLPSQQAPCNSTATSTSLSHQQPRVAAPTYQSGPYSRGQRLETSGGLPSALELLMDVDSQSGAKLRRKPELCSNFDSLNISEFGTSSTRVNAVRTGGSPDIVCLSDDD
ncbi:hypothetical protein ACB092_08G078200 [Castanea dentata]